MVVCVAVRNDYVILVEPRDALAANGVDMCVNECPASRGGGANNCTATPAEDSCHACNVRYARRNVLSPCVVFFSRFQAVLHRSATAVLMFLATACLLVEGCSKQKSLAGSFSEARPDGVDDCRGLASTE